MKSIQKFLLAAFLFSAIACSAQVPGYLGKRFYAGYNFNFFPYMNFISYQEPPEFITWANKHEFSASYVLGRKLSFSASYAICSMDYYFQPTTIVSQNYYYYTVNAQPKENPIKASFIEFRMKLFTKKFVAPTGSYHQIKLGFLKYSLNTPNNSIKIVDNYGGGSTEIKADKSEYTGNRFAYGIGRTKIINGGRLYYDTQLMFTLAYFDGDIEKIINPSTNNYVKQNLNLGMRAYNRVEILVGLGVLIF